MTPTTQQEALTLWQRIKASWPKTLTQQENEAFERLDACLAALESRTPPTPPEGQR